MNYNLKKMKYIHIEKHGEPNVLKLRIQTIPEPGPDQVLIKVAAAGVNRPDIMQRKGFYPPPSGATKVLGLEVSGSIVKVGDNLSEELIETEVCALVNCGGYAEYCTANIDHCLPVPMGMSLANAASLPETYFTIWSNIFMGAALKAGEVYLVHGGAGGLGRHGGLSLLGVKTRAGRRRREAWGAATDVS